MPRRKKRERSELASSEPDDDSIIRNSQQRKMATPKEHIEEIRRRKFSIGGEERNPLTEDLHQAVKNLSAELYAKDVHFLMELIQNAEDNEYMEWVDPSLEFIITSKDITATGALATLLIFNNEKGFSPKNIDSICSVGRSTKKGNRNEGFIGEKGIGFKSVFLITSQPYIFSNGYQIRFNEDPCSYCNVGYIVPEWVDENPTISVIKSIYGSGKILPTTVIILPLKPDKINAVKQQLLNLHPEVLLFLSKIKSLSVQEINEDPSLNTVNRIAISSEKNFAMRKNIDAESYMLHLSAEENSNQSMRECGYYMWRQKFQVRRESRVEKRMEVDEFWITLAFPIQDRLHRGTRSPGVYAFLPTEMITNFPFIIQADFVLVSSRETILLDDKWNQGILDCVPSAFVSAFTSLLKSSETAPLSSLTPLFTYIPVKSSSYPKFDLIREAIRTKLIEEDIIPSESCTDQKFFHKPKEVRRLMPSFRSILKDARAQGVSLHNLSSRGRFILSSSFDSSEYDDVLNFLGVKEVSNEWYPKFLGGSDLILDVDEKVYVKLLAFVSGKWDSKFYCTSMRTLPLVKYIDQHGSVSLCSASDSSSNNMRICLSTKLDRSSWLIEWNKEFRCKSDRYFVPTDTDVAIGSCTDKEVVLEWLKTNVNVVSLDVFRYAVVLLRSLASDSDSNQVVTCAHFLYHSLAKKYISQESMTELCTKLPLLTNSRRVITTRSGVLVPGKGSKWVELMGSNPWSKEGYIELGEAYLKKGRFAGEHTPVNQLMVFLKTYVGATDIPHLHPPNSGIPAVSGPLTRANALLLLEWIRNLKYSRSNFPDEFLKSIKMGSWLRVTLSGASPGYRPPSQSFFPNLEWGKLFQNVAVNIDVPLIDQDFYGGISIIEDYKEELKMLGVMCEYGEACEYIGNHLMSLSSSSTTLKRSNAFSILVFVRFLRDKYLPVEKFVSSITQRSWLKTTLGVKSPAESVLFDEGWRTAAQITNIPFLDHNFYGEDLFGFKEELKILGVIVGLDSMHNTVVEYLKPPKDFNVLKQDTLLLVLICIRLCESADKIVTSLKDKRCLKTNSGYRSPAECFWPDPEWSCLLQVLDSIPVVDVSFYSDNILTYKEEMTRLGVVADLDKAVNAFCETFRQQATSLPTQKITSFLACFRKLSKTSSSILSEVNSCITEVKWLRTKSGDYKSPGNCILYGKDWKCISQICSLPLLDDEEIQGYKKELKNIGVVVNLEDGIDFVISGLRLPKVISPDNVLALLKCIRIYLKKKDEETLPESFLSKVVSQDWLKTHAGYLPPNRCSLFDPQWAPHLKPTDGPFIDELFYKAGMINNYRKELQSIGVIVDVKEVCHLMAGHIYSHSDTGIIMRIYDFLRHFEWDKEADDDHQMRKVWIPLNATWASPKECVRHDKNDLFSSRLNVLDKDYETKYLEFFSRAFRVKKNPSMDEYYNLWKEWEVSKDSLSVSDCCAFWGFVVKHWSSKVEKMLTEGLKKLPVVEESGKIVMSDKCDAFIPDDLMLKDIFAHRLLFVWYPKTSDHGSPNRVQLLDIYRKIGVLPISQYLNQQGTFAVSVPSQTKKSNSSNIKGLVKLILSFLANPPINMEVEKRHEAVKCLADVSVFESVDPITVSYELPLLSSGEVVSVMAKRMVRWERESSKIFVQKRKSSSQKDRIEYGVHLGEEISKGVIWDEKEENINALAELIKLGYLLEFDEEAMDFLIKSKNLQVFDEDVEFLSSSAFLPLKLDEHLSRNDKVCVVYKKKRW